MKVKTIIILLMVSSVCIYNLSARYYNPVAGRFLTADTVTPGGGADLQGLNRYSYCTNNPVKYTDPTGHEPNNDDFSFEMILVLNMISDEKSKKIQDTAYMNKLTGYAMIIEKSYMYAASGYRKYQSLDEAGIQGLTVIKDVSNKDQEEWGFPIDLDYNGKYYNREMRKGDKNNAPQFEIYNGLTVTTKAIGHSHYYDLINKERNNHDEYFSGSSMFYSSDYKDVLKKPGVTGYDEITGGDIRYSHNKGVIMYVITPSNQMKRYNPFTCEVYNITKDSVENILPITPGKWEQPDSLDTHKEGMQKR